MKSTTFTFILDYPKALALAQFVKRCSWIDLIQNAASKEEAERMGQALYVLQNAMADKGFSPR